MVVLLVVGLAAVEVVEVAAEAVHLPFRNLRGTEINNSVPQHE